LSATDDRKNKQKKSCSVHKMHYILLYNSYIPMSGLWNTEKHKTVNFFYYYY